MKTQFNGADRFVPISYKETWAPIREVAEKSGTPYNKSAFDVQAKREADAAAKKQSEEAQKAQSAAPAKQ
jgi:phosphonate transport system substrate-binding protein